MSEIRPALLGLPYDGSSSYLRGAAEAPPVIRAALHCSAGNPWTERLVKTICDEGFEDHGDLALDSAGDARRAIETAIAAIVDRGQPFVALGGDHSVTYPILRGLRAAADGLTILHLDAHPDLYEEYEGDRFSHACPMARIMEERLAARIVQVGIRAATAHQREQARRYGVEQIDMRAWTDGARPEIAGNAYLSIDLDAIDPAFAPGVSHREPGGLSVRDVLMLLDQLDVHLVGADVVEFNPRQDIGGLTAGVAAKIVKELLAKWQTA